MDKTITEKKLEKLQDIQLKLNGDKTLYNDFSDFNYRNLEEILTNLKPLLSETKTVIHFADTPLLLGGGTIYRQIVH